MSPDRGPCVIPPQRTHYMDLRGLQRETQSTTTNRFLVVVIKFSSPAMPGDAMRCLAMPDDARQCPPMLVIIVKNYYVHIFYSKLVLVYRYRITTNRDVEGRQFTLFFL